MTTRESGGQKRYTFSNATSKQVLDYVEIPAEILICGQGYPARLNKKGPDFSPGPFDDL